MTSAPVSPRRINAVAKCVYKSKRGLVNGKFKHYNQDAFILTPTFGGVKGSYIFGVCDGHGAHGHEVAGLLQQSLPSTVERHFTTTLDDTVHVEACIKAAYAEAHRGLEISPIDITFSGSTVC